MQRSYLAVTWSIGHFVHALTMGDPSIRLYSLQWCASCEWGRDAPKTQPTTYLALVRNGWNSFIQPRILSKCSYDLRKSSANPGWEKKERRTKEDFFFEHRKHQLLPLFVQQACPTNKVYLADKHPSTAPWPWSVVCVPGGLSLFLSSFCPMGLTLTNNGVGKETKALNGFFFQSWSHGSCCGGPKNCTLVFFFFFCSKHKTKLCFRLAFLVCIFLFRLMSIVPHVPFMVKYQQQLPTKRKKKPRQTATAKKPHLCSPLTFIYYIGMFSMEIFHRS